MGGGYNVMKKVAPIIQCSMKQLYLVFDAWHSMVVGRQIVYEIDLWVSFSSFWCFNKVKKCRKMKELFTDKQVHRKTDKLQGTWMHGCDRQIDRKKDRYIDRKIQRKSIAPIIQKCFTILTLGEFIK